MNAEKLSKLQSQVRIGGKGSARRKKKIVRKVNTTDDKKIQSTLKKLAVTSISGIEEVNMIKTDGKVINFNNPTVQASLTANTFAITGHSEEKHFTELLPNILHHLGADGFNQLKRHASNLGSGGFNATAEDDDEVPNLVENFEEVSKAEATIKKVEVGEEADDEDDEEDSTPEKPKAKKASKKTSKKGQPADSDDDSSPEKDGDY